MADKAWLVSAVRAHADINYSAGKGWGYVVESFSDADILAVIGGARTIAGAIKAVGKVVACYAEVESTAF